MLPKSLSTKQCLAELSSWIIPPVFHILPKNFCLLSSGLLPPPCIDSSTPSSIPIIWEKPYRWRRGRESRPAAHKMLISHTRKIPLTKQQFSCNHPIRASFMTVITLFIVIAVVWFFLTLGFIYRCIMLILISQWSLNPIWQKHWMVKIPPSKIPNPLLHLSMLFGKPCLNYCLFFFLFPPFFISNFINFFWPHSSCDYIA